MTSQQTQLPDRENLALRPAHVVMDLARLGTLHPYRLSFMRSLVRSIMLDGWSIDRVRFDLCDEGYGTTVYEVDTGQQIYSFVVFANRLDPARRSDRVIAEEWDVTATFRAGQVDDAILDRLRKNVPLQEKGRVDADCIVLTRANKSARNFEYVLESLASGKQPNLQKIAKVGYLYRTTAVYGSGKFGMADWAKVCQQYAEFSKPFMAEMLACFLIREFSLDQVEHVADRRAPNRAVHLHDDLKRYFGIGNATGLGMAPYLINHPLLISNWLEMRETALARIIAFGVFDEAHFQKLKILANRAVQHLVEIATDNVEQNELNHRTCDEMRALCKRLDGGLADFSNWRDIADFVVREVGVEAQELFNSLLLELYPNLIDDLADQPQVDENYALIPEMPLTALQAGIQSHYDWALEYDFDSENAHQIFWYRSEEKMEPRLGARHMEPGDDREIMIGIAYSVQQCDAYLTDYLSNHPEGNVAEFVAHHPDCRKIIRRMQAMINTRYGEIRANLLDRDVLPINLLRCKLSFFGVSKFDPRSRLWVRNTMFQGAPIRSDMSKSFGDDWCFPTMPKMDDINHV